jgi:hypothetical protein
MKVNKNKFGLRMDQVYTQPLSILFFGQREGRGGEEAVH